LKIFQWGEIKGLSKSVLTPAEIPLHEVPPKDAIRKIQQGQLHTIFLHGKDILEYSLMKDSGSVSSYGVGKEGQLGTGLFENRMHHLTTVPNIPPVQDIAAGYLHSVALTEDGRVYTWGSSQFGQVRTILLPYNIKANS
jgi:alpha-tubulin suppressor-like RCC1 family protein